MSIDVINCPSCDRRTAAARGACIYCGGELPVTSIQAAPHQRNIDYSERAFNTVIDPARSRSLDNADSALASALGIEAAEARGFVSAGKRLPVARSQNRQEAEMIAALVRSCGLAAEVVADADLRLDVDLLRARRIVRARGEIEVHHAGGATTVPLAEIRLMVMGALRNMRVDYSEGISVIRSQSASVLDTSEFRSDEVLLDVYSVSLELGFRIRADAFDYSGLVWPLQYRAAQNLQMAVRALHGVAPHAVIDDDFARVRGLLSRAWPERSRTESRGVKRAGLAYRPVAQSSVISDNRDQFDRYSRLMFLSSAQ